MYDGNKVGAHAITINKRELELDVGYSLLHEATASYASTEHAAESQVELRFHGLSVWFICCAPCRKPPQSMAMPMLALPSINLWYV